MISVTVHTGCK